MVDGSKCIKCGGSGELHLHEDDEDCDYIRDKERDDRNTESRDDNDDREDDDT